MTPIDQESPANDIGPSAPAASELLEGYLQITVSTEGHLVLRGTRSLVEWLLPHLAREGWQIELDSLRWCG